MVLAFGESGLSYSFSGTTISTLECTPLMSENTVGWLVGCIYLLGQGPIGDKQI